MLFGFHLGRLVVTFTPILGAHLNRHGTGPDYAENPNEQVNLSWC